MSVDLYRVAKKGEEVKWYNISKRLTFSAACRAATGTALTDEDLDEMFPIAVKFGHGVFSPVRMTYCSRRFWIRLYLPCT